MATCCGCPRSPPNTTEAVLRSGSSPRAPRSPPATDRHGRDRQGRGRRRGRGRRSHPAAARRAGCRGRGRRADRVLVGAPGETVDDIDALLARARHRGTAPPAPVSAPSETTADARGRAGGGAEPDPRPVDRRRTGAGRAGAAPPAGEPTAASSPVRSRAGLAREAGLVVERRPRARGPGGRIVRRDVERRPGRAAPPRRRTAPATDADGREPRPGSPTSRTRGCAGPSRAADREQAEAPHFYLRATCQVDRLLALRAELNEGADVRVSVNDLVVKAVARAHVRCRSMNVVVDRRTPSGATRRSTSPSPSPPTTGCSRRWCAPSQTMTVTTLARTTRDLVERARSGRLRQDELEGGSHQRHEPRHVRHRGVHRDHQPAARRDPRGRRGAAGAGRRRRRARGRPPSCG